jgi:hypothetical protein
VTWFLVHPLTERAFTYVLFALFVVTSVRLCRYSSWIARGAPNPFLPRVLIKLMRKCEVAQMAAGRLPSRVFA